MGKSNFLAVKAPQTKLIENSLFSSVHYNRRIRRSNQRRRRWQRNLEVVAYFIIYFSALWCLATFTTIIADRIPRHNLLPIILVLTVFAVLICMHQAVELIRNFRHLNESMNETGHRPSLPIGTQNANAQIATASDNNIERIIDRCTIIIPYPNE